MIASGFLYQTFVATKMLPTQWPSQNIQITVIRPSCWKWLPALSVTAVLASSLSLVGWLHTLMMTLMSPPVQSWHSTKICSAVPTRNKLGADITFLQRWEEERVTKCRSLPVASPLPSKTKSHWTVLLGSLRITMGSKIRAEGDLFSHV